MDIMTAERRSRLMSRVRSADTQPELQVRRLVWRLGYRYRLHDRRLPGTPDIVMHGPKKVIFVHGCFWHMHEGCPAAQIPKTRRQFWLAKLQRNRERDAEALAALKANGWQALVLWECELKDRARLLTRIVDFVEGRTAGGRAR